MAQYDTQNNSAEMANRFVQFVMMQAQQILFVLGTPTPDGEAMPPNLEGGKMLIDQMEMIKEKTKGNLGAQEAAILEEVLTKCRLTFVQASGGTPASMMPSRTPRMVRESENTPPPERRAAAAPAPEPRTATPAPTAAAPAPTAPAPEPEENRKKYVKVYG